MFFYGSVFQSVNMTLEIYPEFIYDNRPDSGSNFNLKINLDPNQNCDKRYTLHASSIFWMLREHLLSRTKIFKHYRFIIRREQDEHVRTPFAPRSAVKFVGYTQGYIQPSPGLEELSSPDGDHCSIPHAAHPQLPHLFTTVEVSIGLNGIERRGRPALGC